MYYGKHIKGVKTRPIKKRKTERRREDTTVILRPSDTLLDEIIDEVKSWPD